MAVNMESHYNEVCYNEVEVFSSNRMIDRLIY